MVRVPSVDTTQLLHVILHFLFVTHFRQLLGEVAKLTLWLQLHVPVAVHVHDLVNVVEFKTLALQLQLALLVPHADRLEVELVESCTRLGEIFCLEGMRKLPLRLYWLIFIRVIL